MFKDYNQYQTQLLPPNLADLVEKDHIARLINQVIDEIDISFIANKYSANGQRAYHPAMLLKILVYGYTIGIRSSRKLADRLKEDVVFMWLAGSQTPDFRTIADFRKDKLDDVKQLFVQVLNLCHEIGIVRIGKVFIDGTKIKANASGNKMKYRKVLKKQQDRLRQQVDDIFAEADKLDREEEELYGNSTEHHVTGLDLNKIKQQIDKINRRKATLKRHKTILNAKQQDTRTKLRKMRKDRNSMSSTDKDATLMMMKEGYFAPAYNVQLATEKQVIVAYGISSDRNDQKLLKPLVKEIEQNSGQQPKITIADAGYGSKRNYRFLKNRGIASFIPYGSFNKDVAERNRGVYELPRKIDTELERYKFKQRCRLLSDEGKELMKQRRQDVEPVIGDLKQNQGFRTFHMRGKTKCLTELGLVSIGHNLKKIKTWVKKLSEWDDGGQKGMQLGTILGYQPSVMG